MDAKWIEIISLSAVFNLSVIAVLSWIKSKNKPAYFWLGCMFFAAAWAILDNTTLFMQKGTMFLNHTATLLNLLWGVYLIEFIRSLKKVEITSIRFNPILFIPVILYLPFLILTLLKPDIGRETIATLRTGKLTHSGVFYNLCIVSYSLGANIFLLVREYFIKNRQNISIRLRRLIFEFLWLTLVLQILAFVPYFINRNVTHILLYMPIFGQVFFLYFFVKYLLSTKSLYYSEIVATDSNAVKKYANINLDMHRINDIRMLIENHFRTESPHLQFDYNINKMSLELNIQAHVISMVINSQFNNTFPGYINSLRIEKAIQLLSNVTKNNYTIEAICYESGFNNRASFYKAFKKETGKLPSDFLKKVQNDNYTQ